MIKREEERGWRGEKREEEEKERKRKNRKRVNEKEKGRIWKKKEEINKNGEWIKEGKWKK